MPARDGIGRDVAWDCGGRMMARESATRECMGRWHKSWQLETAALDSIVRCP